jgi:hypothetical protein
MDRIVLLALLAVPLLIVIHVALFRPIGADGVMFWPSAPDDDRVQLQGYWQSPEQLLPAHFVVERTTERGS